MRVREGRGETDSFGKEGAKTTWSGETRLAVRVTTRLAVRVTKRREEAGWFEGRGGTDLVAYVCHEGTPGCL
jgi:hypothetical protein